MRGVIAGLLLFVAGAVGLISHASAHHNGPWLPGDPADYPVQARIMQRGYVTYCFDSAASQYPGFRSQAAEVSQYATRMHGLPAYEVPFGVDCDVTNTMPPDASFTSICGSGAAACIEYWRDPVKIYYRRALGYSDWRSALCHEGSANSGHVLWLHEHYDDANFRSLGRDWTCMDFGTNQWRTTEYDRDRIFNAFVPDRPRTVSLVSHGNGWATVKWDNFRADNGAAHLHGIARNTNATRVAFGWSRTPDAPVTWAGEFCGPEYGYCYSDYREGSRGFDSFWSGCLWLRAENAAFWWVPQMSAPHYWTLAGCWGTPEYDTANVVLQQWWADKVGEATCITWNESRFNPNAVGGAGERGPFQVHPIHIPYIRSLGRTWDEMFNWWHNAAVARHIYNNAGDWSPWTTRGVCGL